VKLIAYILLAYVGSWVSHGLVSMVIYIFTGQSFNPIGLDNDRASYAAVSCVIATILGGLMWDLAKD